MKVIRVHQTGGAERMQLDELPTVEPGPGQVRIRVAAAGVNYIDVYHRMGQYPLPLPVALGREGAGEIEAVGDGVELAAGARVAWTDVMGSYATEVIAPAEQLVEVPDGVELETAAAAMLQGLTAHYLATSTFPLSGEHSCLIHAAAGGVGLLLCQMARRAGARVIGTTSTQLKAQRALDAGANEIVFYGDRFADEVRARNRGRGVDVAYDSVGRSTFAGSLDSLAPRGMLVLFGQSSGPVEPIDPQVLNRKGSLFLTRPTLGDYVATRDELLRRSAELMSWIAGGELSIRIDKKLPLDQAAAAHRALETRKTSGKLLLVPQ